MKFSCCDDLRRQRLRQQPPPALNGIDFIEVVDHELAGTALEGLRQTRLRVFFVRPPDGALAARLAPFAAATRSGFVRITGGERVVELHELSLLNIPGGVLIQLDGRGDFSRYSLSLVEPDGSPLAGLDPELASVDFSFKVECPSPLDCAPAFDCPVAETPPPAIDYLARDYNALRQVILDRLAVLAPGWQERNVADLGITLVELMAYAGDYLGYRLDAVATEAYLGTARLRPSVRRHARLLDYDVNDGSNARTWVRIIVRTHDAGGAPPPAGLILPRALVLPPGAGAWAPGDPPVPGSPIGLRRVRFATRVPELPFRVDEAELHRRAERGEAEVFEPLHDLELHAAHNEFRFYTWLGARCCLPRGATSATLAGHFPQLRTGDVIILAERIDPRSGNPADADPARRHAVRLTSVSASAGSPASPRTDPVTRERVTEIAWSSADALPFPLTVSAHRASDGHPLEDVAVAWGNIVLAEHGRTLPAADVLPPVPGPDPALATARSDGGCGCDSTEPRETPARYEPVLPSRHPIAQTAPEPDPTAPAADGFPDDTVARLPAVVLGDDRGVAWTPQTDLLSSGATAPEFVGELRNDGTLSLRFGDDRNGERPAAGTVFTARYRVGTGVRGNIGADTLAQIALGPSQPPFPWPALDWIAAITNPIPARGGSEPETLEQIRQLAPNAFRTQLRAVTPDDYARRAERHPDVQRAAATLRWTGSWHTVFLSIDRQGGLPVDATFEDALLTHLEPYRMAGQDIEICPPRYVPLQLTLHACVEPDTFRSDVLAALRTVFSSRRRSGGGAGFFHPDHFTFGQPVVLSRIYAAAADIPGLRHLEVTALHRWGQPDDTALQTGTFAVDRLEIVRLDSNPNFPDRGVLAIELTGGR
jgi:hypothetical protein